MAASGPSAEKTRFASLEEEEIKELLENVDAKNTKRSTSTAVKAFRAYLTEKLLSADFENFSTTELDERLATFYCEMRTKKSEHYKKSTLISYRHGIQRHLENSGSNFDIVKGDDFKKSVKAFKSMTKELKKQGLANVEHFPAICDEDLEKIYAHLTTDLDDAQLLQYKVFMDIMLHFGRRGRENLATLTRSHFAVTQNAEGSLYVYMTVDEKTKNHQDDNDKSSDGRMYEIKESPRCPVRTFVKYIRRLNPNCDRLFQQARTYPKDGIYYNNVPLGHNKLGTFMQQISNKCGLNTTYTNHSCRATTVHVLDAAQFPSRHIMSVTGHKSESSLKTYSGKTDENTRKHMSEKIAEKIQGKCATKTASERDVIQEIDTNVDIQPLTSSQEANLISELSNDDGIDDILKTMEIPQNLVVTPGVMKSNVSVQSRTMNQFPMPMIYNCSNVTINYNILPH